MSLGVRGINIHEADRLETSSKSCTYVRPIEFQNTSPTNLNSSTLWRREIFFFLTVTNVSEQSFASLFEVETCRI